MKGCHVAWFSHQRTWLGINEVINKTCNFTGQNWWRRPDNPWWDLINTNWLLGMKTVQYPLDLDVFCINRMKLERKFVIFHLGTMNTWMIVEVLWSGILRTSNIDKIVVQSLCDKFGIIYYNIIFHQIDFICWTRFFLEFTRILSVCRGRVAKGFRFLEFKGSNFVPLFTIRLPGVRRWVFLILSKKTIPSRYFTRYFRCYPRELVWSYLYLLQRGMIEYIIITP